MLQLVLEVSREAKPLDHRRHAAKRARERHEEPLERHDRDTGHMGGSLAHELHALFKGEGGASPLVLGFGHCDNHLVAESACTLDDVEMATRDGIERARHEEPPGCGGLGRRIGNSSGCHVLNLHLRRGKRRRIVRRPPL